MPAPVYGAVLSLFGKGLGLMTQLAVVFLATGYMSKEEYGRFAMVVSIGIMAQLADIGLSQPLVNLAAKVSGGALAQTELDAYSSVAFYGMAAVAVTGSLLFEGLVLTTNFTQIVFGIPPAVHRALSITVVCYLLSLPFLTAQKLQTGFQKYVRQYGWQFFGTLTSLASVILVSHQRLSVTYMISALQIPVSFCLVANWVSYYSAARRERAGSVWPRLRDVTRERMAFLLRQGFTPVAMQVSSAVLYSAPVWCIGKLFGPALAGSFFTLYRILSPVAIACTLVVTPLWPAYARAWSAGNVGKVRRTILLSAGGAFAASVVGLPCLVVLASFAKRWTHVDVQANLTATLLIAGWFLLMNVRQALTMAALGLERARLGTAAYTIAMLAACLLPQTGHFVHSPTEVMLIFCTAELGLTASLSLDLQRRLRRSIPAPEEVMVAA